MNATQCRMARSGLNLSAADLAKLATVGYATVARFESGKAIANQSRAKLEKALIDAGAQFSHRSMRIGVSVPE
jgi:transcriptional regulator with XRE-family HTH domain